MIQQSILFNSPQTTQEAKMTNVILLTIILFIYRQRLFHENQLDVLAWAMYRTVYRTSDVHTLAKQLYNYHLDVQNHS